MPSSSRFEGRKAVPFSEQSVEVEPKQQRNVTFSVSEADAIKIAGWLRDALNSNINTPYASEPIRIMQRAFEKASR